MSEAAKPPSEVPRPIRAVPPARPGVLSLTIKDKNALYAAYMPFLKGGGIFIPSSRPYKLGEEVFMLLSLMESKEKIPVAGHVIWITPKGAQGGRTAGIGVQFSEKDSGLARNKIEAALGGALNAERPTHTM